jgi:hypothetical protein
MTRGQEVGAASALAGTLDMPTARVRARKKRAKQVLADFIMIDSPREWPTNGAERL